MSKAVSHPPGPAFLFSFMSMFDALLNHIDRFVKLTPQEQQQVVSFFTHRQASKKDFLLSEGDICQASFFVLNGLLRMYFIKDNGHEQITQFALDGWWVTDQMSFDQQKPSGFFIQAVEASHVAVLTRPQQEELLATVPKMERYFRIVAQKALAAAQMRFTYLFDQTAEERYLHFSKRFPEFVQRVPQYMLASMLYITPEVLSKIKAKR